MASSSPRNASIARSGADSLPSGRGSCPGSALTVRLAAGAGGDAVVTGVIVPVRPLREAASTSPIAASATTSATQPPAARPAGPRPLIARSRCRGCPVGLGGCTRRSRRRPARRRRSRYRGCIGDASGVPAETWSVSGLARSLPTGTDAERFRGVVDNASSRPRRLGPSGRRLGVVCAAEGLRDTLHPRARSTPAHPATVAGPLTVRQPRTDRPPEARSRASPKTASSICSVTLPVNVFCWLTW